MAKLGSGVTKDMMAANACLLKINQKKNGQLFGQHKNEEKVTSKSDEQKEGSGKGSGRKILLSKKIKLSLLTMCTFAEDQSEGVVQEP